MKSQTETDVRYTNVITYQSPHGETIRLTQKEVKAHRAAGTWPRDSRGEEYCTVSHGLHWGVPSSAHPELAEY